MGIQFQEEKRIFTLQTEHTAYQFKIDSFGFLLHLYYGERTEGDMDYLLTYYDRGFSGNPYEADRDRTYSMDVLPQEFPCMGNGDYRNTALVLKNGDGAYSCDFRYAGHRIYKGKYALKGLPAVYAAESQAETLEVVLEDRASRLQAVLLYGVLPKCDIITRSVRIINKGRKKAYIEKAASACLDFLYGNYDFISFYGRHCMERCFQRMPVSHGTYSIGSRRGTSSHQYNPAVILADEHATETAGLCYGMVFVFSGGFQMEVEKDQFNQTRAVMGLQSEQLCYPLPPEGEFIVPETVLTCSTEGFGQLSRNYHRCFRKHLCRGKYRDALRPVLINSWEADYFGFTGSSILRLADDAARLGMDMVVLDDGWFGERDNDDCALGDWYVNEKKLGGTLGELAENINRKGLKFGLWIEPEMISENSQLYREHPDWVMAVPGRKPVRGRYQLVLDFSREDVRQTVFDQICSVLDNANVEYVKWDMNRSIADVYSLKTNEQGRVLYDYVLGVYDFLEKLGKRYPDMLIEGCSGGGGRYDAGMLYYTPQIWCSDNTDAVDRVKIQYGTSFFYPASTVGAHVSAVPNHQTGRQVSLHTRGVVAMAGAFGYELDPAKLSPREQEEIKEQIRQYHRFAPLILNGDYYRLTSPYEEETGAWAFVSEDKSEVLLNVVMLEIHGNMTTNYVKLQGLAPEGIYEEEGTGRRYTGRALMAAGLPMPIELGEYLAYQMYFRRVE